VHSDELKSETYEPYKARLALKAVRVWSNAKEKKINCFVQQKTFEE
jgi:hypothetical protein